MTWIPDNAERLSPSIRWSWLPGAVMVGLALAALAGLSMVLADMGAALSIVSAGGGMVIGTGGQLAFNRARYRNWWFVLRDRELLVGYGVLLRRRSCVPRQRIQHVDLHAGPLLRKLGLQVVSVYTAGSTNAAVEIPGLSAGEAEQLRTWLLKQDS